jgi:hypothetical protein
MKRVLVLVAFMALFGCQTTGSNNIRNIIEGQSRHDVIESLGEPQNTQIQHDVEALQYCQNGFMSSNYVVILLHKDKVIGREKYTIPGDTTRASVTSRPRMSTLDVGKPF